MFQLLPKNNLGGWVGSCFLELFIFVIFTPAFTWLSLARAWLTRPIAKALGKQLLTGWLLFFPTKQEDSSGRPTSVWGSPEDLPIGQPHNTVINGSNSGWYFTALFLDMAPVAHNTKNDAVARRFNAS
ncbi:hypothetical protein B0H63DRAFT_137201 [Podospora didyma]|uniref:Uncharacterized protein n=1 Tax=Podospora didyma TaxID=330526 RepID=A0AAE0U0Y3_9PEZI|nr:hypothetical protein B0H63DRAFT_137201 [Podospora didyma]